MGPNLDPGIKAYIKLAAELYDDELDQDSIEDQRQAYLDLCEAFARPHPPVFRPAGRMTRTAHPTALSFSCSMRSNRGWAVLMPISFSARSLRLLLWGFVPGPLASR